MLGIKREELRMIQNLELSYFSKNSNHVEKLHTIQRVQKFALNSLLVTFSHIEQFAVLRCFMNQQSFDAINSHHSEKAENKMRIELTNLRKFEHRSENNLSKIKQNFN